MTLYYLKTNVKSAENAVLYSQGKIYDAIYDFAVSGTLQSDQLPKNLYGKCQPGIGANELKRLDYLHSFGGVPIFSNNLLGVASRTIIWSLVKQMWVRCVPLFHRLHRRLALER